jgi:peptidyl-prolyl cis-trans isomerase B (cyclophilin B)
MADNQAQVAEIKTTSGDITIRFFPDVAPNHVKNFLTLAQKGFYNGTKFHRVIPGFMVQGGDPNTKTSNTSSWGTGGSGTNINAEFSPVSHKRGIVSMARSNSPNSASSQFFIVVKDSPFLDRQYTVFGETSRTRSSVRRKMPATGRTIRRRSHRSPSVRPRTTKRVPHRNDAVARRPPRGGACIDAALT